MATSNLPTRKVHIVGSIPLPTTTDSFERLATSLPHLTRLPDGEPGSRGNFVVFQSAVLAPHILPPFFSANSSAPISPSAPSSPLVLHRTGYDEYAILSYLEFCRLRNDGVIPAGVRFQVCLPSPVNVVAALVLPEYQVETEKLYEQAILDSLRSIQDNIPKEDLAIQWDMPLDVAYMEYAKLLEKDGEVGSWLAEPYGSTVTKPWFSDVRGGVLARAKRLMGAVDEGVEMGIHLCYGDLGHKHYLEPKDTSTLVEFANALYKEAGRKVEWIHMPVPKSRVDEEFYAPLKGLKLGKETELYLGLVHPGDREGTEKRIETARRVVEDFGVSTECGYGRSSEEDLTSILEIMKTVTA